jgi:hypothetical protein
MSTPLTPRVQEATSILFVGEQRREVLQLLQEQCADTLPLTPSDAGAKAIERIQLAVLKRSDGSLPALQRAIELSKRDWRDSLVGAGFADDIYAHLKWIPTAPGEQD